jgi:hypothetical protein
VHGASPDAKFPTNNHLLLTADTFVRSPTGHEGMHCIVHASVAIGASLRNTLPSLRLAAVGSTRQRFICDGRPPSSWSCRQANKLGVHGYALA